jgi:hypothetical protein|tara:strand:+ start:353 stop:1075 length:723 start_codon:yes stop_codon:yes gene_type:complete
MKYYVYTLNDTQGNPFYVGKGTGRRMYIHEWNVQRDSLPNGGNKHLYHKIKKVGDIDYQIIFRSNDEQKCYDKEIELIEKYGIENLCNLTYGGDGLRATDEIKAKISKALTGLKQSKETISKRKNIKVSEKTKRLISEKTKLAMANPLVKEKMRKAKLGQPAHNLGKDSRKVFVCETCSSEIKSYVNRRFCSVKCRTELNIVVGKCKYCNKEFKYKKYRNGQYCSNTCQRKVLYDNRSNK